MRKRTGSRVPAAVISDQSASIGETRNPPLYDRYANLLNAQYNSRREGLLYLAQLWCAGILAATVIGCIVLLALSGLPVTPPPPPPTPIPVPVPVPVPVPSPAPVPAPVPAPAPPPYTPIGPCCTAGVSCMDPAILANMTLINPACVSTWTAQCVAQSLVYGLQVCSPFDCCDAQPGIQGCNNVATQSQVCQTPGKAQCCISGWTNDCIDTGVINGYLVCAADDCCTVVPGGRGCNDPEINQIVCTISGRESCCMNASVGDGWTEQCVAESLVRGTQTCSGETCCLGAPAPVNGTYGCNQESVNVEVCRRRRRCCSVGWDPECARIALTLQNPVTVCDDLPNTPCCFEHVGGGCEDQDYLALLAADPVNVTATNACLDANVDWSMTCIDLIQVLGNGTSFVCPFNSCCLIHDSPGCDQPAVETVVCGLDPTCCSVSWHAGCAADTFVQFPNVACIPPNNNLPNECCDTSFIGGCQNNTVMETVCFTGLMAFSDPDCCTFTETSSGWNDSCVELVQANKFAICNNFSCCTIHEAAGCNDLNTMDFVCSNAPLSYCCIDTWDDTCLQEVLAVTARRERCDDYPDGISYIDVCCDTHMDSPGCLNSAQGIEVVSKVCTLGSGLEDCCNFAYGWKQPCVEAYIQQVGGQCASLKDCCGESLGGACNFFEMSEMQVQDLCNPLETDCCQWECSHTAGDNLNSSCPFVGEVCANHHCCPENQTVCIAPSCSFSFQCPTGYSCLNKRCQIACLDNGDCPSGSICTIDQQLGMTTCCTSDNMVCENVTMDTMPGYWDQECIARWIYQMPGMDFSELAQSQCFFGSHRCSDPASLMFPPFSGCVDNVIGALTCALLYGPDIAFYTSLNIDPSSCCVSTNLVTAQVQGWTMDCVGVMFASTVIQDTYTTQSELQQFFQANSDLEFGNPDFGPCCVHALPGSTLPKANYEVCTASPALFECCRSNWTLACVTEADANGDCPSPGSPEQDCSYFVPPPVYGGIYNISEVCGGPVDWPVSPCCAHDPAADGCDLTLQQNLLAFMPPALLDQCSVTGTGNDWVEACVNVAVVQGYCNNFDRLECPGLYNIGATGCAPDNWDFSPCCVHPVSSSCDVPTENSVRGFMTAGQLSQCAGVWGSVCVNVAVANGFCNTPDTLQCML